MRFGKLIGTAAGVLLIVTGLALTVAGGVALAVPDDDGWITIGPARVRTEAAAVVADDIHVDLDHRVTDRRAVVTWGEIPAELRVEERNDKLLFIGVGPAADVDEYLRSTSRAYAGWDDDDIDVVRYAEGGAAADPTAQTFWVATSTDGTLEWDVSEGDWSVVVLNADGSPGIDVAVTGAAQIPFLAAIGVGLLTGGLLVLGLGAWLTYLGVRAVPAAAAPPEPRTPLPVA